MSMPYGAHRQGRQAAKMLHSTAAQCDPVQHQRAEAVQSEWDQVQQHSVTRHVQTVQMRQLVQNRVCAQDTSPCQ